MVTKLAERISEKTKIGQPKMATDYDVLFDLRGVIGHGQNIGNRSQKQWANGNNQAVIEMTAAATP